jgi:uncharacterized protein (TIGR03435 family)
MPLRKPLALGITHNSRCQFPSIAAAAAFTGLLLGPATPAAFAQPETSTPGRLAFEVASIKPSKNTAGPNTSDIAPGGQRFTATNTSLKLLIMIAYEVNDRQVSDGPGWLNSEFYDVEAKAEHSASRQQIHLMLQSLLADRFKLVLRKQTKEVPMYVLTAENYQSHLRENTSGGEVRVKRGSSGKLVFENAPMSQVTWFLSSRLHSEVVDKTGLTGKYDFEITPIPTGPENAESNPNSSVFMPPGSDGPSVFMTLVRQQLGLKMTATKGPIETLVVDRAEKPSAN